MPAKTFQDFRGGVDRRKSEQIVDQFGLYDCKNAFINSGFAVKKRAGLDLLSVSGTTKLAANSVGLFEFNESLYVVSHATAGTQTISGYGVGSGYPISTSVYTLALPDPDNGSNTVAQVWQFIVFNNNLYVVVEYADGTIRHHYGTSAQMIAGTNVAITDTNCPNGKSVCAHDSKIYGVQKESDNPAYVKYSSTEDPTNWSKVKDASGTLGLPAGLEASGNEFVKAVTSYRGFLCVFMENSIQLWKTNPNPALTELNTTVDNAFVEYHRTIAPINEDVFYLNSTGIHSVGQKVYTDTMSTTDVGSPIADLVVASLSSTYEPKSVYFPGENQYILANNTDMFVFTHSSTAKLTAWTRYVIPNQILDMAAYRNYLFLRIKEGSDEHIYSFNPSSYQDATASSTSDIDVEILSSFNSLDIPGAWKQVYGSDIMFTGTANLQHRWDSRSPSSFTTAISLSNDTRPGVLIPVELMTTEIGYKVTQSDNSDFQLKGITYYYNNLGLF